MRKLLRRSLPPRVGIVAAELARFHGPRYLEIGVHTGVLFLHVRAAEKVAVDPAARVPRWKWALHPNTLLRGDVIRATSDEYFAWLAAGARFEVIFVDGDHSFEQSLRDVEHALDHLSDDGVVLVHDCNPPDAAAASPDPAGAADGPWCGDVWKTVVHLRATRADLDVGVIDTDFGVAVVRHGEGADLQLSPEQVASMTYAELAADRERLLGLRGASIRDLDPDVPSSRLRG